MYLLEENYKDLKSFQSISKRDFIYRLLLSNNNFSLLDKMISIFTWDSSDMNYLNKLEVATILNLFLVFCNKNDYTDMLTVQEFYLKFQSDLMALDDFDKKTRVHLLKNNLQNPYSPDRVLNNSLVDLFLGHLSQLEFKDRNKYLK